MADNTHIKGPKDQEMINVNQPHEVRYWSQTLRVTPNQLTQAVQAVGPRAADVRNYLKK